MTPLPPRSRRSAAPTAPPGSELELEAEQVGRDLSRRLSDLLSTLPEWEDGPQKLARRLDVDKVLTSRLLKCLRQREPLAAVYHAPGPEPLRRVISRAAEAGVAPGLVEAAGAAVERFDDLIRRRAGDRAALNAILAAWLPEERASFELNRKQQAFRGMSDLKGVVTDVSFSAVLLHPSEEAGRLDLAWVIGRQGLRRLRPGVRVKFSTRRLAAEDAPRRTTNLLGEAIEGPDHSGLEQFLAGAPAPIEAHPIGDVVHYTLGDTGFGPRSSVDVLFAEVSRAELPATVPADSGRRAFFFATSDTPARALSFDVHLHEDVYPDVAPELLLHDTCGDGFVDINDPTREISRLDVAETVTSLGRGTSRARSADVPRLAEVLRHVQETLGWDGDRFRGYRTRIGYPIHGAQVTLAFRPPPPQR